MNQISIGAERCKVFFEEEKVLSSVSAVVTLGQEHGNGDNKEPKAGNDREQETDSANAEGKIPPSTSSEVEKRIKSPEEQKATKPSSKKPRIIRRKTEGSRQQDLPKDSEPSHFFFRKQKRGSDLQNLFLKKKGHSVGDAKELKAGYERESHKKNTGSVAADSEICSCC